MINDDDAGDAKFQSEDYMAVTPEWAVFGNPQRGFDPKENR